MAVAGNGKPGGRFVLSNEEFESARQYIEKLCGIRLTADKKYVLVVLDFPKGDSAKAAIPNAKRNAELQRKYGASNLPAVLLMTAEGQVFGRGGYQAGGVPLYLKLLSQMGALGKVTLTKAKAMVSEHAAAEGDAKESLLQGAIKTLSAMRGTVIGIELYAQVVRHGLAAENIETQTAAINALLRSSQHDAKVYAVAKRIDPKDEHGLITSLLKTGITDEETVSIVIGLDPKNEKGLLKSLLLSAAPSTRVLKHVNALDPKNKLGLQETVVMGRMRRVGDEASARTFLNALDALVILGPKDPALFERLLYQAIQWTVGPAKDMKRARIYAALLKKHAKETKRYARLFASIEPAKDEPEKEAGKREEGK